MRRFASFLALTVAIMSFVSRSRDAISTTGPDLQRRAQRLQQCFPLPQAQLGVGRVRMAILANYSPRDTLRMNE